MKVCGVSHSRDALTETYEGKGIGGKDHCCVIYCLLFGSQVRFLSAGYVCVGGVGKSASCCMWV